MSNQSKFAKKSSARTHDEARASVCCSCGRKVKDKAGGVRCVNARMVALVCQYVDEKFSLQNTFHPTALCVTCRVALCALEKVNILV